jgi:hypothetical protein
MATETETVSLSLRATAAPVPSTLEASRITHETADTPMSGQSDSLEWDDSVRTGSADVEATATKPSTTSSFARPAVREESCQSDHSSDDSDFCKYVFAIRPRR